jgi:hypothetical protein
MEQGYRVLAVCVHQKQNRDLSETQFIKSYYMTKIVYSGVWGYLQVQKVPNISGTTKFRQARKCIVIKDENVQ